MNDNCLYMKTNIYEEKLLDDKMILIPKNNSNLDDGIISVNLNCYKLEH